MRFPGTLHQKGKPVLVTLHETGGRGDYVAGEIVEGLPEVGAKKDKPLLSAPDVELDQPGNIARAVAHLRCCHICALAFATTVTTKAYLAFCQLRELGTRIRPLS